MQCRITDLRDKEVINICDGSRLGYVSDVELLTDTGQILSILVPESCKFFGLIGEEGYYVIPWGCIRKFGDDIILVELPSQECRTNRKRRHG